MQPPFLFLTSPYLYISSPCSLSFSLSFIRFIFPPSPLSTRLNIHCNLPATFHSPFPSLGPSLHCPFPLHFNHRLPFFLQTSRFRFLFQLFISSLSLSPYTLELKHSHLPHFTLNAAFVSRFPVPQSSHAYVQQPASSLLAQPLYRNSKQLNLTFLKLNLI